MKEPDFDASSLEDPETDAPEPQAAPDELAPAAEGSEPVVDDAEAEGEVDDPENSDGSTLERHEDEVLYVKRGSLRRRPKYGVFGVIGGLIGLIAGLVLAQVGAIPAEQDYTRIDLSIVLVGIGVPVGILLSLAIALLLDRRK